MINIPVDLGQRIIQAARLAAALHQQELESGRVMTSGAGRVGTDAGLAFVTDDEAPDAFDAALCDVAGSTTGRHL
jgi:hypothetical protein